MPRPKRTKVASRAAPTRVAKPAKPATPAARPSRATRAPSVVDNFSDDSDGLVVKATQPRPKRPWYREAPAPQGDVDFTMTGGLAVGEARKEGDAHHQEEEPVSARNSARSARTTTSSRAPLSSLSKAQPKRKSAGASGSATSPIHDQQSALPTQKQSIQDESSLLDPSLLTFGSLDSDSPAHGTRPPSAIKVGATPAHDTSILALTNFKRRARQPSLLRMVHQTTDVEDNDMGDYDELDDFNPEDESTPLHAGKDMVRSDANQSKGLNTSSSSSRGTKRKLSSPVIQVPRSSPPIETPSRGEVTVSDRRSPPPFEPSSGADIAESERSSSPSLPDNVIESREDADLQEEVHPEVMSETMAPPRSSSTPVEDTGESPVKQQRTKRKPGRPRRNSDATSPGRVSKQKPKAQGISTAKLQALLPRRRRRAPQERDEFDIQSSDDVEDTPIDSDQDELQLPPRRVRQLAASKTNKKTSRTKKKTTVATGAAKKNTATYTRRTSSDKENSNSVQEVNEDSLTATETSFAADPKLAAIAKKFEDVDAWEMEFESVDVTENSSPWR